MKLTTLIENSLGENKSLTNEHGLSMFIETPESTILFDTGKTGDFIENAKKLNVDLKKVDYLILSHAHYDHCGGVKKFLNAFNIKPKFYVSEYFFDNMDKYHYYANNKKLDFSDNTDTYKYIGIDFDKDFIENKGLEVNFVDSNIIKISSSIYIFTNFEKTNEIEKLNPNMKVKINNNYVTDTFKDEIVLAIDTEKGLLILTGCSHPGIINIVDTIRKRTNKKIYGVIGGTHLVEADKSRIEATIKHFKKLGIELIGVSHCTGETAVKMFKKQCNNFFINSTGTTIEI
ncbi:MBL fold metallo-hydrolase [Haloimpatiens sp. FM7330]|uniref:MBL fold metallo-hydrolase n=1 Tax=Haloimpatiens sp. FM7330 TaxID=3298610 RepID=UPI00362FDC41